MKTINNSDFWSAMTYAVLIIFFLTFIIPMGSALEFDNVDKYSADNKIVTITNAFGLGKDLGTIELKTPFYNIVPVGYGKVMEIEINSLDFYTSGLGKINVYDVNRNNVSIEKELNYYFKSYETKTRDTYGNVCSLQNSSKICYQSKNGTEPYQSELWTKLIDYNLPKGLVTLGIFTDMKENEVIDLIPTIYGQKLSKWAIAASDNQLFAYYKLDETSGTNADDSAKYNRDATSSGNALVNQLGKINTAYNFTTSAKVLAPFATSALQSGGVFTFAVWLNISNCVAGNQYLIQTDTGGYAGDLALVGTSCQVYSKIGADTATSLKLNQYLNQWVHFVYVSGDKMYVNGVANATVTGAFTSAANWGIGGRSDNGGETYRGKMDEIGIWNRSLSQAEVTQLYNAGAGFTYPFAYTPTVTLTNPLNNTGFTSLTGSTFNATASYSGPTTTVNATRYLYTNAGALISTNFTNIIYAGNKTNFTIPNLAEGVYQWNIQMCKTGGNCAFGATNFTFTLDSTSPVVTIPTPVNASYIYPTNQSNSNYTLNISATDVTSSLSACWFNSTFNATPTFMTCNSIRQVNLTNVFGLQTIYAYANDTANNQAMNQTSIIIPKVSYNSSTNILSSESFQINQTYFYGLSASAINLIWNGTSYGTSITLDGAGNTIGTYTLNIPNINGTINFYFNTILSNGTVLNSSTYTQNVYAFTIDDCGTGTTLVLNFTNYDQDNLIRLPNNTYNVQVRIGNSDLSEYVQFASNYTTQLAAPVCMNINLTQSYRMDAIMQWNRNASYFTQYYNIQNYTLTNASLNNTIRNISLYNLLQSSGQVFNILIKDANYLPLQDAIVQVDRQYINLGTFLLAESPKTDALGSTVGHFILNNQLYNIYIKKNGQTIATFSNQQPYCNPTLTDCVITFNLAGESTSPTTISPDDNVYYVARYNDTLRTYYIDYTSVNSSSNLISVRGLDSNSLTVCSNSVTSSSGTITCVIPTSAGNQTILIEGSSNGELIFTDYVQVGYTTRGSALSLGRYLLAGLLLPAAVLMVAGSSAIGLIMFCLGLILCAFIFLIDTQSLLGAGSFIIWFVLAAVILIIKLSKRGSNG